MKYSIITPVYNRADCVARCLDSVIVNLKSGIEIEHIVVDDGSDDESANIVEQYTIRHKHIKLIKFPKNRGTNAARNAAIKSATGDFCIILDSDDYFINNALKIVDHIVSTKSYKAYMFAADDMVDYYKVNPVIKGASSVELNFRNFLRGEMGGDFIHCISTDVLKAHPFDENLRVYEGVFFLSFFKDAEMMLFTNRIVTIRERSRNDSVTRTMLPTEKNIILKHYEANLLRHSLFSTDYISFGEMKAYERLLNNLLYFSMLLSKEEDSKHWHEILVRSNLSINRKNQMLYKSHTGHLYYLMLRYYFIIKYQMLKSRLK